LPLYGDGLNRRDWIYVTDNCLGIDFILAHGKPGAVYNLGAGNIRTNREITYAILRLLHKPRALIQRVPDRLGHDRRYALALGKIRRLGWRTSWKFNQALASTVKWYQDNPQWWRPLKTGAYLKYYRAQYIHRHRAGK
ncbi:GDP-mannose 4,6-dehydratase, partial [candidate division FCPU426 bacterium]|nr:GDP-mannose 4,6-dehydratase [candidate division FCPU426 bacterium]